MIFADIDGRSCICGRTFRKAFGLRVHQRTCPHAMALAQANEELAATVDGGGCPEHWPTIARDCADCWHDSRS